MTFIKMYLTILLFFQLLTTIGDRSISIRAIAGIFSLSTVYALLVLWGVL